MSIKRLTKLREIQETGMDFDTVENELINIIKDNPNWSDNWTDFIDSEAGIMFIDLFSWIADNMTSRQDLLFNEMFIGTAQADIDKIRHLKQIGYVPKMANAAEVPINIKLERTTKANEKIIIVPAKFGDLSKRSEQIPFYKSKDISGKNDIEWEILGYKDGEINYIDEVAIVPNGIESNEYITNGSRTNQLKAFQGRTHTSLFTSESGDGDFFTLDETNIAANSIQVFIESTGKKLKKVKSFISTEALDSSDNIPYVIELTEGGKYRIRFANSNIAKENKLLKPRTNIVVFYRVCNGRYGNISPETIVVPDAKFFNNDQKIINAEIRNYFPALGGKDKETLDEATEYGPLSLVSMNRAVTPDDYDIIFSNNPKVYKSKTYTESNEPEEFKNYFGRCINPQETYTFLMMNRSYNNVPTEKYNYFPWVNTIKEPRINERYIFDNGGFNKNAQISNTYYNLKIIDNNGSSIYFNNATAIYLGDEFNNSLYLDKGENIENDFLKLKITNNSRDDLYFNDIPFNIFDETSRNFITMKDNYLSFDDHAKFISRSVLDNKKPIDVKNARYLTFVFDDNMEARIDFWQNGFDTKKMPDHAYMLWDNIPEDIDVSKYKDSPLESDAINRYGIIQIINNSINSAINGNSSDILLNEKFKYCDNTSKQFVGLSLENKDSIINNSILISDEIHFSLNINKKTYVFDMKKEDYPEEWGTLSSLIFFLNDSFNNLTNVRIYKEDNTFAPVTEEDNLNKYEAIISSRKIYDPKNTDNPYEPGLITYDLCIINRDKNTDVLTEISYYDSKDILHNISNVIDVEDPSGISPIIDNINNISYNGLFKILRDTSDLPVCRSNKNIPIPFEATDYRNPAKFNYINENSSEGRFVIQSPIIGERSSLYFIYNNENKKDTDFGKEELGIFYNNYGKYSAKVHGQKKAYMFKKNVSSVSVISDGNINTSNLDIKKGNIIFENSCMFNDADFNTLFGHYKLSRKDTLQIGSSYDNYYYSGNPSTDDTFKEEISGILGQSVKYEEIDNKKVYSIDLDRSKFLIKFTKEKQNTNSIFQIKNDLDIVSNDIVSMQTNEINFKLMNKANLIFSIDNNDIINIDTSKGINNGDDLIDLIKEKVIDMDDKEKNISGIRNNINSIIKTSYSNRNKLIFNSLSSNDGKISFIYDKEKSPEDNKEFYKNFLGTSITNKEFYRLYRKEDQEISTIVEISENEYYYCPTENNNIDLKYHKLIKTKNGYESREADYKIIVKETYLPDIQRYKYQFFIKKSENSHLPDNYFYMHFVNDKTYDYDDKGNLKENDETILQKFMYKHKISGTDLIIMKPYFSTYDIKVEVKYNSSEYDEGMIREKIVNAINNLCGLENSEIAGEISIGDIYKVINNCEGVISSNILFFGDDVNNIETNTFNNLKSQFYEIKCIHETTKDGKGLQLLLVEA